MIRVRVTDAGAGRAVVEHVADKIAQAKKNGALSAALRLVQIITTEIIPRENPPPIDQRSYIIGWSAEPTNEGASVFNTSPHATIIEDGAKAENIRPGRAMIDALAEWVVRKGLLGKDSGSIQGRSQEQEAQSTAWAIVQNMRKRGIFNRGSEGLGIAKKAGYRAGDVLEEEIRAELEELLGK